MLEGLNTEPRVVGAAVAVTVMHVLLFVLYVCMFQVFIYCARRIHAHLRCTQCSILLHLIDICFLTCICLWQISQIQTCLCVVGPGLVSTLPAFMRSIASHPAGPHGRLCQKTVIGHPFLGTGGVDTICIGFARPP